MLSRLHDCLFKDLVVPFMILKFRKLTLSFNCQTSARLARKRFTSSRLYLDILEQYKEYNVILISQIIVLF